MKILITYSSDMENTEKIAGIIKEATEKLDVDLISIKEVNPIRLISSDLIFLTQEFMGSRLIGRLRN